MRGQRRAGDEHFLDQDVTFKGRAFVAAILFRPGHADPALLAHGAAEIAIERTAREAHQVLMLFDEGPDLLADFLGLLGHFHRVETEGRCGHGGFLYWFGWNPWKTCG